MAVIERLQPGLCRGLYSEMSERVFPDDAKGTSETPARLALHRHGRA